MRRLSFAMKNIIIADFDETITVKDTISVLARLPYNTKAGLEPSFQYFTDNYLRRWKELGPMAPSRNLPLLADCMDGYGDKDFRSLFGSEIKYQEYNRQIEKCSTDEMTKSHIFKDISHPEVDNFARNVSDVTIREGFRDCIKNAENFYIISVNWSTEFIHSSIGSESLEKSNIYCHNLLSEGNKYTGEFSNELLTGFDKVKALKNIIKKFSNDRTFWYVGDSETDLLTILHPEVNGILLLDPTENPKKFNKLTENILGVPRKILEEYINDNNTRSVKVFNKNEKNSMYIVKDWKSISDLLS